MCGWRVQGSDFPMAGILAIYTPLLWTHLHLSSPAASLRINLITIYRPIYTSPHLLHLCWLTSLSSIGVKKKFWDATNEFRDWKYAKNFASIYSFVLYKSICWYSVLNNWINKVFFTELNYFFYDNAIKIDSLSWP